MSWPALKIELMICAVSIKKKVNLDVQTSNEDECVNMLEGPDLSMLGGLLCREKKRMFDR